MTEKAPFPESARESDVLAATHNLGPGGPLAPRPARALPTPPPGYEILGEIGHGGMGAVYRARQKAIGRVVALKILIAGDLSSADDFRRFQAEATAIGKIRHPNIVQIFEVGDYTPVGSSRPLPYIALEFAEGGSLHDRLQSGPLPPRVVAGICEAVARAAEAAHQQGVVHRDLKPGNILLQPGSDWAGSSKNQEPNSKSSSVWNLGAGSWNFVPKVCDFGLAKQAGDGVITRSGILTGTPNYMAPEQASGRRDSGPAIDIHAIGVILYQCLTGRLPFHGHNAIDTLLQVQHLDPIPPSRFDSRLSRDLEVITLKCLAKDPRKRYPTAGDLADDLRRWLDGRPITARRVGPLGQLVRWAKRRPGVAALIGCVIAVTALGVAGVAYEAVEAIHQRDLAVAAREEAEAAAYGSRIARARVEYETNQLDQTEAVLNDCPDARRGWEWHYLDGLLRPALWRGTDHSGNGSIDAIAIDRAGTVVASTGGGDGRDRGGEVILRDADTGRIRAKLTGPPALVRGAAFSPDGRLVAAGADDGSAWVWSVVTGSVAVTLRGHQGPVLAVAFLPDGRLATASRDGTIRLWDVVKGVELRVLKTDHSLHRLSASADGQYLAAVGHHEITTGTTESDSGRVYVWDAATGRDVAQFPAAAIGTPQFPADGRSVIVNSAEGAARWDLATRQRSTVYAAKFTTHLNLALSPDGQYLAGGTEVGDIRLWNVADGREVRALRGHRARIDGLTFSPDGCRLFSGSQGGIIRCWDLSSEPEHGGLLPAGVSHYDWPESVAFPGADRLLVAGATGYLHTIHPDTGSCLRQQLFPVCYTGPGGVPVALDSTGVAIAGAVHHDGRHLGVWDVAGEHARCRVGPVPAAAAALTVNSGATVLAAGGAGFVAAWSAADGRELFRHAAADFAVHRLAVSADGRRLAVAHGRDADAASELTVYDLATGRVIGHRAAGRGQWHGVTFTADGRRLAAAGPERAVLVWNLETGFARECRHGPPDGADVAFNPAGTRLAVADRSMVVLLDAATGEELLSLRGRAHLLNTRNAFRPRVRFRDDGNALAAICHDSQDPVAV